MWDEALAEYDEALAEYDEALAEYDEVIGLDLEWYSLDGSPHNEVVG